MRNDKIDLGVGILGGVEPVEELRRGFLPGIRMQMLANELFGQRAFINKGALIDIDQIEHIVPEQAGDKTDIEKQQLEVALIHAGPQGRSDAIGGMDGSGYLRLDKQVQQGPRVGAGCSERD